MSSATASPTTLIQCLRGHATARPDEVAMREVGVGGQRREFTWRELCAASQRVAGHLKRHFPGQTVVVALPNCAEAQIALLGALWSGAPTFPCSPQTPENAFRKAIETLGKCVLVAHEDLSQALLETFPDSLTTEAIAAAAPASSVESQEEVEDRIEVEDNSLVSSLLLQSSGTTGHPKIVRREMSSLVACGRHLARALSLCPADRILVTIPLCHSYGIDLALSAANAAGSGIELHHQYAPTTTRSALTDGRITVWPAVPLMFDTISRGEELPGAHQLRLAISAGSPLPRRIYDQFLAAFDLPIGQIYGASEFGSVFYNSPALPDFDPLAVGRPLTGVEARVLSPEQPDTAAPLPCNTEGEVAIRAPSMMSDYLDSDVGPDRAGFLRTGDVGSLDEAGVLRLTGRFKLFIDIGAQKVNPLEVETVLGQHPTVQDAVVVAVARSDTASRLKAFVEARTGQRVDPDALRVYLREHLISYKVPRIIEVCDALPRSPTGKILRSELQAAALEGQT